MGPAGQKLEGLSLPATCSGPHPKLEAVAADRVTAGLCSCRVHLPARVPARPRVAADSGAARGTGSAEGGRGEEGPEGGGRGCAFADLNLGGSPAASTIMIKYRLGAVGTLRHAVHRPGSTGDTGPIRVQWAIPARGRAQGLVGSFWRLPVVVGLGEECLLDWEERRGGVRVGLVEEMKQRSGDGGSGGESAVGGGKVALTSLLSGWPGERSVGIPAPHLN